MGRPLQDAEEVEVRSRAELRAWLVANAEREAGIWLVSGKKAAGESYLAYAAIVEECLCFGWVDSLGRAKDENRSMLWIAPRKAGSSWSAPNKARVERLEAAELMAEAGRRVVASAKHDGSWERLDPVERLDVPPDLAAALDAAGARATWDRFPRSVRRGILEWILIAKRPATRAKRVEETAREAAGGRRANSGVAEPPGGKRPAAGLAALRPAAAAGPRRLPRLASPAHQGSVGSWARSGSVSAAGPLGHGGEASSRRICGRRTSWAS